jgi:hypothetical protein
VILWPSSIQALYPVVITEMTILILVGEDIDNLLPLGIRTGPPLTP